MAFWPPSIIDPFTSVGAVFFIPLLPSEFVGPGRGHPSLVHLKKRWKYLNSTDFSYTCPSPSFLRPVHLPADPDPVGTASASIRRVRCPSASSNQ